MDAHNTHPMQRLTSSPDCPGAVDILATIEHFLGCADLASSKNETTNQMA